MTTKPILSLALAAMIAPAVAQAEQAYNAELNARLPESIREAGSMIAVTNGSFPPMSSLRVARTPAPPQIWRRKSRRSSASRSPMQRLRACPPC